MTHNQILASIRDAIIYGLLLMIFGWKITLAIFLFHWAFNVALVYWRAGAERRARRSEDETHTL